MIFSQFDIHSLRESTRFFFHTFCTLLMCSYSSAVKQFLCRLWVSYKEEWNPHIIHTSEMHSQTDNNHNKYSSTYEQAVFPPNRSHHSFFFSAVNDSDHISSSMWLTNWAVSDKISPFSTYQALTSTKSYVYFSVLLGVFNLGWILLWGFADLKQRNKDRE